MADSAPPLRDTCADYLAKHRATLEAAIEAGQRGLPVAERYASMYDGLLGSLCCAADAAAKDGGAELGRVALVAVGGYGRRLVAPQSDADVLFLCDDPSDTRVVEMAESVLYPLWDVGVDIGHAVRGLEETLELSETDIRTSTTLLDLRHVAGDRAIVEELHARGRERIFDQQLLRFVEALESDTTARQQRFGDSLYLLEPEIKLGRGGLRDLDVIQWCARARYDVASIAETVAHGLITEHELGDLRAAEDHLWTVRNRLHLNAGRRNDRLTFEEQEAVAAGFGYRDGMILATEQLMHEHFRHAAAIARIVDRVGDRVRRSLRPPPTTIRDLGDGVLVHDGKVTLKTELDEDPALALRLYTLAVREDLPPDSAARDAVSAATSDRDWCRRLRRAPGAAEAFCDLLAHADRARLRRGSLLEELHEQGLLVAMIPEMEAITGRTRHDAFHVYTVDAQAVMAVDKLRELARGELASEFLAPSRCAAEMPQPLPVYLAILLHGLGTGHPDDPAKHAAAVAGVVAERLGLSAQDTAHVQWLIANQSVMYFFAMRRDITDPDTVAELAQQVQSVDRLRDLYLLTFCSHTTANPAAMTAWNARMLQDLWTATAELIEGGEGRSERIERLRRDALEGIDDSARRREVEEFVEQVPPRYLLGNTTAGIHFHSRIVQPRKAGELAFGATESGVGVGTMELVVACDDRPGLLADLTAALAGGRFSVDSAQLYTRSRPGMPDEAFDLFHISHANMVEPLLMEEELEKLRTNIERIESGAIEAGQLLERRSTPPPWARSGPRVKTEIHVDNASSSKYTVVDVYTKDRTDLLHVIARTLHERGLTIGLAKVNTEGDRVADVFYVRTQGKQKLSGEGQLASLSKALRAVIRDLE